MAGSKFDPQVFFQRADNVALLAGTADVFGLLKRSLNLPAAWAALVTKESGSKRVVRGGGVVEGDGRIEDVFFVRITPVELAFDERGLAARDGFRCDASVKVRVGVICDQSELSSFRQAVLGSRNAVQASDLSTYLEPAVRNALVEVAGEHDAVSLVESKGGAEVAGALADALKGVCFSAGLTLDATPDVRFDSEAARRVQASKEEVARKQAEHEAGREMREALAKAQREHVDHLSALLDRLNTLAKDSPEVELPELLKTFSEKQRGELYAALFEVEKASTSTQWIVVAAGEELLFFEPGDFESARRRLTIVGDAGQIRSIQTVEDEGGTQILLLGAATGVYHLPLDRAEPECTYLAAHGEAVRGGFNAAAMLGGAVYAAHSELGLRTWSIDKPGEDRALFESVTREAKAVRGVCTFDGDLFCAIDDRVIRWKGGDIDRPSRRYVGSDATITALCVTSDGVFAGNCCGDVLLWSHGREDEPEQLHRGPNRAAESIWLLSGGGVKRLVFTDTSLCVHAQVLDDSFVCEYEAGGQTLRRVEVAPDLIAATSDIRDRIICWSPGKPKQPCGTIPVSRLTGRSVQDVCLVRRLSKLA